MPSKCYMAVIRIASSLRPVRFHPSPVSQPRPVDRCVRRAAFIFALLPSMHQTRHHSSSHGTQIWYLQISQPCIISYGLKPSKSGCLNHLERTIDLSGVCLAWLGPSLRWERPPYGAIEVHRDPCMDPHMVGRERVYLTPGGWLSVTSHVYTVTQSSCLDQNCYPWDCIWSKLAVHLLTILIQTQPFWLFVSKLCVYSLSSLPPQKKFF